MPPRHFCQTPVDAAAADQKAMGPDPHGTSQEVAAADAPMAADPPAEQAETEESQKFKVEIDKLDADVTKRREDVQSLLESTQSLGTVAEDPAAAEKMVEKLQQRCLESSEYLMRDMLSLDELVAATPDQRAKRKQQIVAIQDILDSVDVVSEKLRVLKRSLDEQKAEMREEKEEELARAQSEAEEFAREESAPAEQEVLPDTPPPPTPLWGAVQ